MSIASMGNSIYVALREDPASLDLIQAEYASLALKITTDPNASAQVTSSTVNGQSFSTSHTMTNGQRIQLLEWVCECRKRGSTISTTAISYFS